MTEYAKIANAIAEANQEPDWGSVGRDWDDDGRCDTCGGNVEWPPTGEPASAVCVAGCKERLSNAWNEHQKQQVKP